MKLPKQGDFRGIAVPVFVSPSGIDVVPLLQFLSYFLHPEQDLMSQRPGNLYFWHLQRHLHCFLHVLVLYVSLIQHGQLSFLLLGHVSPAQCPRAGSSRGPFMCFPDLLQYCESCGSGTSLTQVISPHASWQRFKGSPPQNVGVSSPKMSCSECAIWHCIPLSNTKNDSTQKFPYPHA